MKIEKDLKYSREHEWIRQEGNTAYVGITDYAQNALGSIVFIEMPKEGTGLCAGDTLAVVESVKAASDIYSPVSGVVKKINRELAESSEKLNEEPYKSWVAAVELNNASELENLMNEEEYRKFCEEGT